MPSVMVIQRHAHLAGPVRIEYVRSGEGDVPRAVMTAISNRRRGDKEEATSIQWTLWGEMAQNAALYLCKGSHVNVVGRLRNDTYEKNGATVYSMTFTAEEIDYLDSRAEGEARRGRGDDDHDGDGEAGEQAAQAVPPTASRRNPRAGRRTAVVDAAA